MNILPKTKKKKGPTGKHFSIFKKGMGRSPPLCLSNILENAWNKLFSLCQGFEYAWSSYLFNRPLKMPCILNVSEFWIYQSSGTVLHARVMHRVLNKSEYGSACACDAWTCLNMAECPYSRKYAWKYLFIKKTLQHRCFPVNFADS